MEASGQHGRTNAHGTAAERWSLVAAAIEELGSARTLDRVVEVLRHSARRIAGADGIAIVLSDDDLCHYVAEDAMSPLWAGQRFPRMSCISGIAMEARTTIVIPDVLADPRVPHAAYAPTFVRSMAMVPIGSPDAVAALGAYWSETGDPGAGSVALLETLGRAATTALENGRLLAVLKQLNDALDSRVAARTAELERTQAIARQAQKMEVIGQLTGNVAHDFNNLLTPIMGGLDLVINAGTLSDGVARSAQVAMEAAERAKLLVQRLLAFARRQPLVPRPVALGELVDGMRDLLISSLGPRIALLIDVEADLPAAQADRHQLELALLNLAVNARDAMPDGGSLSISVCRGAAQDRPTSLPPGDFLCVSVRDDGVGMDEAVLAQAIEPFFTTKDAEHGTGLGLSMVDGLAAQLGGGLQIFSAPGHGAEMLLWLPVAATAANIEGATSDAIKGAILVVDDEQSVRSVTAEMIENLGFEVVQAASARSALDLIEDGFDPVVVVTDHVMPGMTGAELCQRLRRERPHIAVMIVSGYQGIDLIAPDVVRLAKPFRSNHLRAGIAAARQQVVV